MKSGLLATVFALTALGVSAAQAQLEHTYNFLDFGYERNSYNGEIENFLDDSHGFAVDLSVSPAEYLIFASEFHFARPKEFSGEQTNAFDLQFGVGGYLPISDTISFYATVGPRYMKIETDDPQFADPSEWGLYVEPGVRINLTENLEMYGAYEYATNYDKIHTGKVGAILHFSENFGVEIFGRFSEDWSHSYGAGIRYSK